MLIVDMAQQGILGRSSVTTFLTDIELGASFLVGILLQHAMDLLHVGFERAALGKSLLTQMTFIWTNTWDRRKAYIFKRLCVVC